MKNTALLKTESLEIGYSTRSLKKTVAGPMNLEVYAGKLICLLGPNGSGKSTLLRTLCGLQPPVAGEVLLKGNSIHQLKTTAIAREISLVLSEKVTGSNLDVYNLIALGRYPYTGLFGVLTKEDKRIIEWAAHLTETTSFLKRGVDSLSDGECQKVMLARALAQDTPAIILDEPTAHLDLPSRLKLMQLLYQLARDTGKAILLSTHELDLALQVADVIWLLDGADGLAVGIPEQLVLDGIFQQAFNHENIKFDPNTGNFAVPRVFDKVVFLEGPGLEFIWTRKALERCGFQVSTVMEAGITIPLGIKIEDSKWILSVNGRSHDIYVTLSALLLGLEKIDDPAA